jgi:uncharacterized membrane protein YcaP (DUF421 family)/predicted RNA-binding Zn-ribbon protein involved in translation (DUF1610 family)
LDDPVAALDLQRMIFGTEPPWFLIEIVVRTLIIYGWALALLRWLGSRTIGQLSTIEFLLVIALGSAVGDAMFYPDVPLLHALLVVTVVILLNKGLDMLVARSKAAERVLDGTPEELIRDGVISKGFFSSSTMGVSELFQELREKGIEHLGQVGRAYVEPDGKLTVFRAKDERPGLPIVPPFEIEPPPLLAGNEAAVADGLLSCTHCGLAADIAAGAKPGTCPNCGHAHWTAARREAAYKAR